MRTRTKKELHFETAEEEQAAALKKAADLLLFRDRSEVELFSRLRDAGYGEEAASAAVQRLKEYGYLNDRSFAETYIAAHGESGSASHLRRKLHEKGVDVEIIREVLETREVDDRALAYEMLCRREGEPHELDERARRRAAAYLARRGFSSSDVWGAIREYQSAAEG